MILYEAILGIPPPQRLATENYEFVPARWVGGLPADVPPGLWDLLCECVSSYLLALYVYLNTKSLPLLAMFFFFKGTAVSWCQTLF